MSCKHKVLVKKTKLVKERAWTVYTCKGFETKLKDVSKTYYECVMCHQEISGF